MHHRSLYFTKSLARVCPNTTSFVLLLCQTAIPKCNILTVVRCFTAAKSLITKRVSISTTAFPLWVLNVYMLLDILDWEHVDITSNFPRTTTLSPPHRLSALLSKRQLMILVHPYIHGPYTLLNILCLPFVSKRKIFLFCSGYGDEKVMTSYSRRHMPWPRNRKVEVKERRVAITRKW